MELARWELLSEEEFLLWLHLTHPWVILWSSWEQWVAFTDIRHDVSEWQIHCRMLLRLTWTSHEIIQQHQVWWWLKFAMPEDVFLVEQLSARPFNSPMSYHSDKALQISVLAGNISITRNYHPQRKESINDLGWNQVWILMKGWPSQILIRGDTFRASLTFLPGIPVETAHWMWAKCRSTLGKKKRTVEDWKNEEKIRKGGPWKQIRNTLILKSQKLV